jgi:phosphoribosylanthranilate isomerase
VRVSAKICGLLTPEAVAAALDGGASHLGFMFFPASPRDIAPEAAAALARPARGKARIVAVVVDPDDDLVTRLTRILDPDDIQLHGRESPARLKDLASRTDAGLIKVLPVSDASDIDRARDYEGVARTLMFEGKPPPDSDRPGGVGASFDWSLLSGRGFERPWFLAGGLDPWNVGEAIRLSGAPMVDVSSGVERGAGLKDPALIEAFLAAVRRA